MNEQSSAHLVAIIGAGPAGLYAAKHLACQGIHVVLINRDIKPGGLAEYGIFPDKHRMKEGLRNQFHQILEMEGLTYYGNLTIGEKGHMTIKALHDLGLQAILVAVGAQSNKRLGIDGEDLPGVYSAKDLVYGYNHLPPYSMHPPKIGRRIAVIGVGNVMMDVVHWLIDEKRVEEVTAVARRGPSEVKFDKKELETVIANLDMDYHRQEFARVAPVMRAIGQDPMEAHNLFTGAMEKALKHNADTRFRLRFLASPRKILASAGGGIEGLVVENNTLELVDGEIKARGIRTYDVLEVDTIVYAIGDLIDADLGLPLNNHQLIRSGEPRFPIEGISYEVECCPGIFSAGWARQASTGLVGVARKDGTNAAQAMSQYLSTLPLLPLEKVREIIGLIGSTHPQIVSYEDIRRLEQCEKEHAERLHLEEFKFDSNEEMLSKMGASHV